MSEFCILKLCSIIFGPLERTWPCGKKEIIYQLVRINLRDFADISTDAIKSEERSLTPAIFYCPHGTQTFIKFENELLDRRLRLES
jgi:hypothetical protein